MTDMHCRMSNGFERSADQARPSRRGARALLAALLLVGCNTPVSPVAQDQGIVLDEDTVFSGRVVATDVDSPAVTYAITVQPTHGTSTFDASSGHFTYEPIKDFNGSDSFTFVASDGKHSSSLATVSITVKPVDDAPNLPQPPDLLLRAEEPLGPMSLDATDVDGDHLAYTVIVADPAIADAIVDASGRLVLTNLNRGISTVTTTATVTVSDGTLQVSRTFALTVLPPPPLPPASRPNRGAAKST